MNELLQKHGCANVFTIPEGLKELMADITREVTARNKIIVENDEEVWLEQRRAIPQPVFLIPVLRAQPEKINDFIANYLSVLMITREHGIMAVKILDDLCDCRPSVTEHLEAVGFPPVQASIIAALIHEEIEKTEPVEGNENVKEAQMLKKILQMNPMDEVLTAKVCQIARNAYRDYWYRKQLLAKNLANRPEEPWEVAAAHTLEIYKRTNPTFSELSRAAERTQAAYRGYHIRRNLLTHKKKPGPKKNLPGPPLDIAESREAELGKVISLKVGQDDVSQMFEVDVRNQLGLSYDTTRMLTHVAEEDKCICAPLKSSDVPADHAVPRTPFPSLLVDAPHTVHSENNLASSPTGVRISAEPPRIIGESAHDSLKVPELPALVSAQDSDVEVEDVAEDLTADVTPRTEDDEALISDATTIPEATPTDATYATDEDVPEGEVE